MFLTIARHADEGDAIHGYMLDEWHSLVGWLGYTFIYREKEKIYAVQRVSMQMYHKCCTSFIFL